MMLLMSLEVSDGLNLAEDCPVLNHHVEDLVFMVLKRLGTSGRLP